MTPKNIKAREKCKQMSAWKKEDGDLSLFPKAERVYSDSPRGVKAR